MCLYPPVVEGDSLVFEAGSVYIEQGRLAVSRTGFTTRIHIGKIFGIDEEDHSPVRTSEFFAYDSSSDTNVRAYIVVPKGKSADAVTTIEQLAASDFVGGPMVWEGDRYSLMGRDLAKVMDDFLVHNGEWAIVFIGAVDIHPRLLKNLSAWPPVVTRQLNIGTLHLAGPGRDEPDLNYRIASGELEKAAAILISRKAARTILRFGSEAQWSDSPLKRLLEGVAEKFWPVFMHTAGLAQTFDPAWDQPEIPPHTFRPPDGLPGQLSPRAARDLAAAVAAQAVTDMTGDVRVVATIVQTAARAVCVGDWIYPSLTEASYWAETFGPKVAKITRSADPQLGDTVVVFADQVPPVGFRTVVIDGEQVIVLEAD